ncbi:MAG: DUF2277 domain-containing protein [Myxococcota bacterium]
MCRNIKTLHHFEPPATREEVHASALQYVRKLSGMREPSKVNRAAFERAVEQVTKATLELFDALEVHGPPRSREEEALKAKARGREREARLRARLLAEG